MLTCHSGGPISPDWGQFHRQIVAALQATMRITCPSTSAVSIIVRRRLSHAQGYLISFVVDKNSIYKHYLMVLATVKKKKNMCWYLPCVCTTLTVLWLFVHNSYDYDVLFLCSLSPILKC